MTEATLASAGGEELVLSRVVPVPRSAIYRAWTTPELVMEFFVPKPWSMAAVDMDPRPGGRWNSIMRDPDGKEYPNSGVYLELVPDARIVFTDAYTEGWVPSGKPFFTGIIELSDEDGGTRYTARARHWRAEDKAAHEKMGFHEGWGAVLDQLVALIQERGLR
jgi:uncharacterized protein YndB with AHSA1/START domain